MKVSIIIPTYKGSNSIGRALGSLKTQKFKNFEVIVADDNGEGTKEQQATEAIVKKFEKILDIKYYKHKININGSAARNTGIRGSSGDYIAFLDDDDVYLRTRLSNAVYELNNNKEYDLLFCSVLIQRHGKLVDIIKPYYSKDIQKELILNTSLFGTGSNIFLRKEVIDELIGFDEAYSRRQDNEFLLRALENHSYKIIDKIDIVKSNNGSANIPAYEKLVAANERYYNDFAYCFKRLSKDELKQYKEQECSNLFFCSLMNEKWPIIEKSKKDLNRYRKLKIKEKVQLILSSIRVTEHNLLQVVQPILSRLKNKKNHESIIKLLDEDILLQIREDGFR